MPYKFKYGEKAIEVPTNQEFKKSIDDTGWIDLSLGSDFTSYSDGQKPRYRKIGKMVEIVGAVKPIKDLTFSSASDNYSISTIPENIRPSEQSTTLCQGSSNYTWTLVVRTDGILRMERHRNGSGSYVNATTSNWLPFHVFYFID